MMKLATIVENLFRGKDTVAHRDAVDSEITEIRGTMANSIQAMQSGERIVRNVTAGLRLMVEAENEKTIQ